MTHVTIRRARRLLVLAVGLATTVSLSACSMRTLAHPIGLPEQRPSARDGAAGELAQARQQAATTAEPYWAYRVGELCLAADSLEEAEAALKTALARDPGHAPALALLSKLYYQTGRHAQGVDLLEAARAEPTRFPRGFPPELAVGLALHYEALGRRDLADRAIADVPAARAGSAGVYVALRGASPDSAAGAAAADVHDHPGSAASQNNQGIARLRAGDTEAASRAFLKAIDLDPALPGPYYNLAILEKFYRLDDAAAARWYRAYRERASEDPDGLAQAFDHAPAKPVAEKKD